MPRTEEVNQQIRDERRSQILYVAARVFSQNGYVGTRMDEIASEAKVSKGLIYHYFSSKEVIFNSLIKGATRGTLRIYQEAFSSSAHAAKRLRWFIQQVQSGLVEQPYMFTVVLQAFVSDAVPQEAREHAANLTRQSESLLTQFIAAGQTQGEIVQGDPEQLAFLLGSCIEGLAVAASMSASMASSINADTFVRLFTLNN